MTTETYWKRVRYNGDEPPWQLKEINGKGFAAFATRSFKAGEWICTEFPVAWINGHNPFTTEQIVDIEQKIQLLTVEDRNAFYAMANVFEINELDANKITITNAAGIFMTNSFDMTDSIFGQSCAMYLALARLNHSCTPNVQQTHIPQTTEEVVYAARDIAVGEELNDCYIDLRQNRAARRASLLEHYRFHCECEGCTGIKLCTDNNFESSNSCDNTNNTGYNEDSNNVNSGSPNDNSIGVININNNNRDCTNNASKNIMISSDFEKFLINDDRIRDRAFTYNDVIIDLVEYDDTENALEMAIQAVQLLKSDTCIRWSIRYLPEAHLTVYQIAESLGKHSLAREHLVRAHELNVQLQGPNSNDSKNTSSLLNSVTAKS